MNGPHQPEQMPHRNRGRWQTATLVAIGFIILLSTSATLFTSYSYWGDEMFSVVESLAPIKEFIHSWILWDVHPPLYQVLLRGWIVIFGDGELATRFLSFLFVILALVSMALLTASRPFFFRLVAVSFLAASPASAFYAQETRSYGMMLGLSTLVTLLAMDLREKAGTASIKERWGFGVLALLLSLTHYFGLVWVAFLTILQLVRPSHPLERRQGMILASLLFVWPIVHLLFGELTSKTGGNFWITMTIPIIATVNHAISGLLPGLEISRQPLLFLRWGVVTLLLLVLSWPLTSWKNIGTQISRSAQLSLRHTRLMALMIVIFVAIIALIDLNTPISTARNFIVLLPALALILAGFSQALYERLRGWRRLLLFAILTIGLVVQLKSAAVAVAAKSYPRSNWKDLAAAIRNSNICDEGCYSDFADSYFNYYFRGLNLKPLPKDGGRTNSPLLLMADKPMDKAVRLMASEHLCFQSHQASSGPVVLLPKKMLETRSLEGLGLLPCPAS